ncbi:MAG: tetratricopeptide repeat protein [Desulfobacterales bacterium]
MERLGRNVIGYVQRVSGPFHLEMEPGDVYLEGEIADFRSLLGLSMLPEFHLTDHGAEFYTFIEKLSEGDDAFNKGRLDEAWNRYIEAVPPWKSIEGKIILWHRMSKFFQLIGALHLADIYIRGAYNMISEMRPINTLILTENRLLYAEFQMKVGQLDKAENLYHEALNLLRGKINYRIQGEIYSGLGKVNEMKQQYAEALSFYRSALSSWGIVTYFHGIQDCYSNITNLYFYWAEEERRISRGKMFATAKNNYKNVNRHAIMTHL